MCGHCPGMNQGVKNSLCQRVARSTDLIFLNSFITNTRGEKTIEECDENDHDLPLTHDSLRLVDQVKTIAEQRVYLDEAKELFDLLTDKHIQGLLEVHDEVAAHIQNALEEVKYIDGVSSGEESEDGEQGEEDGDEDKEKSESSEEIVDTFRVIGLRRKKGESLGLTVTVDDQGKVLVARIISGSFIERQGLLRPGDIILEVNGTRVTNPEQLQLCIEESVEFINLKIKPTLSFSQSQPLAREVASPTGKFYVRALYSYQPEKDSLLPCPQIGLPFKYGDILEVVSSQDPSWWQARLEQGDTIGLIPSLDLEERRKCFVDKPDTIKTKLSCCGSGKKEKKKFGYHFRKNAQVDTADLQLYEPVEKMPPFTRKTLVLVGPPGVGRRSLINRIVNSDTKLFGTTRAVTSRPKGDYETDGENFWFLNEEEFLLSLDRDEFLEVTETEGYLYGTTYQSIRSIISQGKLCVVDCRPETLKILHQSAEFLPYVIFLSAPSSASLRDMEHPGKQNGETNRIHSEEEIKQAVDESHRIKEEYQKFFHQEIVVENYESCYKAILDSLTKLATESQWVPLNWVYS